MLAKRSRQHYALIWRNSMEGRAMIGGRRHILRWLDEFGECWLPLEGLTDREFARELALALRREHYAADGTVRRRGAMTLPGIAYSIMFVSCIAFWAAVLGFSPTEAALIAVMVLSSATLLACAVWRR